MIAGRVLIMNKIREVPFENSPEQLLTADVP